MTAHTLAFWNLDAGAPTFGEEAPEVRHVECDSQLDDEPIQRGIYSNYNDRHELLVQPQSLIGSTRPERGPAQQIIPKAPLFLADGQLQIDLSAVTDRLEALEAAVAAIQAAAPATQAAIASLGTALLALTTRVQATEAGRTWAISVTETSDTAIMVGTHT